MYSIFTGNQRSLVFPVMCNAFATIDYSANVPDGNTGAPDLTDEALMEFGRMRETLPLKPL